ncbi:serine/threonine protein kinase [Microcoleus sp. FACHB-SPT15]|nr:serine/threonine protein kinase [Microcoleus sp. FACHB-SPT15]
MRLPDFSNQGYQISQELGRNREGGRITYLATSTSLGYQVVLKQFCFAQSGSSWSGFKAYEREINVLRQLDHPGIPRYLDSFENRDGFCLVQQYVNARSLAEIRPFTPEQIKQIAISALEILVYLQKYIPPVFHRDIKPENILVDEQVKVYLIDFGFSRIGGEAASESSMVAGTPGFMSPEHLHKLTPASDVYSLGATLICLLTGKTTTTIQELIDKREHYRVRFKSQVPEHISPRFTSWLEKMVEPNLKNRFRNAASALAALKPISIVRSPKSRILSTVRIGLSLLAGSAISVLGLTKGSEIYLYFVSQINNNVTSNITSSSSPIEGEGSPNQPTATPIESRSPDSSPLPTDSSQSENETINTPTLNSTPTPTQDPGNTISQALNLGILQDTRTYNDFVGSVDMADYYRFQLNTTSNVQLSLNSLSEYTYLELILDRNGNGQVDRGEVLYDTGSSSSASISRPLGAGTYIFRVYPSDRNHNTTYTLEASATQISTNPTDPGNTLSQALDLGILRDTRTYNDFVGSVDLEDYYRFQLNTTGNVQLSLNSLSEYTYLELILDRNSNGQVDRGEVLYDTGSSSSASISRPLGAGTYIFRVYPSDRNHNTTYTLEVAATEAQTN